MRKPMFLVVLLTVVLTGVQAQTDYTQFTVVTLKPKSDRIAQFEAGMAAHNKKHHTADPYKAWVWSVITGPDAGSYTYVMGPSTFTQLDARKTTPEHDVDWNNNVLAHCESVGQTGYWRWDKDIHYAAAGSETFTKSRMRFVTIKPGQGDRYEELLKKIAEVYKQKKYAASYNVYWHFGATQGPHVAISMDFANWAFFDQPNEFVKDYDSIHGEGAYDRFLDDLDICIERSKTYDELTQFLPELSSN